ncbi:MAG: hypothetical protein FJ109_14145 [Deltaproteobacteria bacterium]|nr:hypothetical protein [Deltaproteobacteria bacterium]
MALNILPCYKAEDAARPTWRTENTPATLAAGLTIPCVRVWVNAAGDYRCYFAGNPTYEDRYLDSGPHLLALWKITGGPTAADMDTAVTAGEISFDFVH